MNAPELDFDTVVSEEEREREAFLRTLDTFGVSDDLDDPVNTDVVIDHYLAALADREAEMARNAQVFTRRVAMLEGWLKDVNASAEREAKWLRQQIEAFARDYDFGKKKSRALPHGTIGYRASRETLEITDMDAAAAFAVERGLETKVAVNKTPLLECFRKDGIVPDGCEYVAGGDHFYIRVGS